MMRITTNVYRCDVCRTRPQGTKTAGMCWQCFMRWYGSDIRELLADLERWYGK